MPDTDDGKWVHVVSLAKCADPECGAAIVTNDGPPRYVVEVTTGDKAIDGRFAFHSWPCLIRWAQNV